MQFFTDKRHNMQTLISDFNQFVTTMEQRKPCASPTGVEHSAHLSNALPTTLGLSLVCILGQCEHHKEIA